MKVEQSSVVTMEKEPKQPDSIVVEEKVTPKARFVGNISGKMVIIPDLRNEVDEEGLTLKPSEKIDLTLYYSAREINRSRGLDRLIQGETDLESGNVVCEPALKVLNSLDETMPPVPTSFVKEKGSGSFEAAPNFADKNLEDLDLQEEKEFDRIRVKKRKTTV